MLGRRRLRRDLSLRRPQAGLSSHRAAGVRRAAARDRRLAALAQPDGQSFLDYLHLIASVWWTLILQWHLWRYLSRALGATFHGTGTTDAAPPPEPPRSAPVGGV